MANMQQNMTPRQLVQQKFQSSRNNLLLVIILTMVNIALLIGGSDTFLLFSASIPYLAVALPVFAGEYELFLLGCVLAVIVLLLYFICWLLSKKRPGWLIVALVAFILDTFALIVFYVWAEEFSGVFDLLIHACVIYYLIVGFSSAKKLKTMPEDVVEDLPLEVGENSAPLYRADEEAKHRVLLEYVHGTYRIVYRRVKHTNELVINGYVYDTYEAKMEFPHVLHAVIDGHQFEVGYSSGSRSYIMIDGQKAIEKYRWY